MNNLDKYYLISDVDDVIRDLNSSILTHMRAFYKESDVGRYTYNNPKISEFFKWYEKQTCVGTFCNFPADIHYIIWPYNYLPAHTSALTF